MKRLFTIITACLAIGAGAGEAKYEPAPMTLVIPISRDAELQLARCREHIAMKDYVKAFRILDGLLEADPDQLVPATNRRYTPMRDVARALVASLPQDGRKAYAFHRSARAHAVRVPRSVPKREPESSVLGLDGSKAFAAAMVWCNALLEGHRFMEARDRLVELLEHPSRREDQLLPRLLLADRMLGNESACSTWRRRWQQTKQTDPGRRLWKAVDGLAVAQGDSTDPRAVPKELLTPMWRQVMPARMPRISTLNNRAKSYLRDSSPAGLGRLWLTYRLPTDAPLIQGGRVFVSAFPGLYCLDIKSGDLVWSHEPKTTADDILYHSPLRADLSPAARWFFVDPLGTALAAGKDLLVRVEQTLPTRQANRKQQRGNVMQILQGGHLAAGWQTNVLAAYNMADGKQQWTLAVPQERFVSIPVVARGRIFVLAESQRQLRLLQIDPINGTICQSTVLAVQHNPPVLRDHPLPLAICRDAVYLRPEAGVVFSLYTNGNWRWVVNLPAERENKERRRPGQIVMCDGLLISALAGSGVWAVVAADSGAFRQHWPRSAVETIAACVGRDLLIAGDTKVCLVDPRTGKARWQAKLPRMTGRCSVTAKTALIPTLEGVQCVNLATGKIERTVSVHRAVGQSPPFVGNLVLTSHGLLAAGAGRIERLGATDALQKTLEKRVQANTELASHVLRAQLLIQRKQWGRARRDLNAVLAFFEDPDKSSPLFDAYLRKLGQRKRAELRPERATAADLGLKAQGYLYRQELLSLRQQTEGRE